jgi:D-alanyl-D-alanine carboxypeptidase
MRLTRLALRLGAPMIAMAVLLPVTAAAAPAVTTRSALPGAAAVDPAALQWAIDRVHAAGVPGVLAAARDGGESWRGAAGVADLGTGRPIRPYYRHRIGSVTKTFVATAVLHLVAAGKVDLDAPIATYLPSLVPGARGRAVTVRMLLNHTSGINDYDHVIYASLARLSLADLERNRFRTFQPEELVRIGLAQPATGAPGQRWAYANTNYVVAGLLIEKVTGLSMERYVTQRVIRPAGLRHTYFPGRFPVILGPHSKAYEDLFGYAVPPGEFSVYNYSSLWAAGDLVSTMDDVTRLLQALLGGRLLPSAQLAEMKRTVPILDPEGNPIGAYGLGLTVIDAGPCGRLWGHDGTVFGQRTLALGTEDARRQMAYGVNMTNYQRLGPDGVPLPHPADAALRAFTVTALCPGLPASAVQWMPERQFGVTLGLIGPAARMVSTR